MTTETVRFWPLSGGVSKHRCGQRDLEKKYENNLDPNTGLPYVAYVVPQKKPETLAPQRFVMKNSNNSTHVQLPHDRKSPCSAFGSLTALAVLLLTLLLGSSPTASAFILDDFNGASLSGWTSPVLGGTAIQSGGQLTIAPAAAANFYTFIKKTDRTFTNLATHSLEFKVQVNGILTNGVTTNGLAGLGWSPTGATPGTAGGGYFMAVGATAVQIWANAGPIYVTNLALGSYTLSSSNLYLAMRMTPDGASMVVRATVYNKTDGRFNVLFEHTVTNSATALIGTGGNAFLGAFNDANPVSTSVSYDNLQVFDTIREVVDDFSGSYPAGWVDHISGIATNFNNGSGQLEMQGGVNNNQVSGNFKGDKTFTITDGVRLELRVDVVNVAGDAANFTILDYAPHGDTDFAALTSYHLAFSAGVFYVGKGYGSWWDGGFVLLAPQSKVRLIQTLTGEGTGVRIESRLEDLSVDVNDPARIVYQFMHLDTSSAYQNFNGYFQLGNYHSGGGQSIITWDNAEVNATSAGNTPPIITGLSPADGKNFYAAAGGVVFDVTDDVSAPINNIKLTLNGVVYTNGSPGVTITPPDASSLTRHFTFTNLATNVFYIGSIQVADNLGATSTEHYEFDTFLTSDLQVESEDFNYSTNVPTDGGQFIDGGLWGYLGLQGSQNIDSHDSRTSGDGADPAHYRDADYPRTYATADGPRAEYVTAGKPELLTYDNENGDWRNYTRTYPAGTFNVFSRQCTFALPISQVTLERVTSDPTTSGQTAYVLGAFQQLGDIAGDTGYDNHKDVPLTDAAGNRLVIRLPGGVETLRVHDVFVNDRNNAEIFHNYLVFVPVTETNTLRPIVSMTSPQAGTTSRISPKSEATFAEIANRDTTVDTNTITMTINGVPLLPAAITITNTTGGAQVYWSFAALQPAASYTHTLNFKDSAGTNLVYSWTYSYPFLRASNSLPLGALSVRGFHVRTAYAFNGGANLGNLLSRAEDQLAIPPVIPADIFFEGEITNTDKTLDWNNDTATPKDVPGLSGVPGAPVPLNNIASEALGFLELTAGAHRFNASSDDGFQLRSGTTPNDVKAVVMGQQDGATFGGTFDFVVEAPGLYPVRNLWYENGGSANFTLRSVNLSDNSTVVVNDPGDPTGVVKAYLPGVPTLVLSSATVSGPYTIPAGAVINTGTKTVTVPVSGSTRFYRMSSSSAVTIQSITVVGGNVVITYL
jgi:hypothetical protein